MKIKTLLSWIMAGTMLLLFAACNNSGGQDVLQVGLMPDINSIPMMVAKQQGYLDDDIQLVLYMSATDRDSALFSGNLDGASSDVIAVCLAHNGGFPLYITSGTTGDYGVAAGGSSGIASAKDMAGREIALSYNTIIEYVTDAILEDMGVSPDSVSKSSVPKTPSRLELLEAGQVDAIAVPEPFVTAAELGGGTLIGKASQLGIEPCTMTFTEDAITGKGDQIQRFYEAYDRAVDYMNSTPPEEYLPAVAAELGLPETVLEMELPAYGKTALPRRDQVDRAAAWAREKDLVETLYTYDDLVWAD